MARRAWVRAAEAAQPQLAGTVPQAEQLAREVLAEEAPRSGGKGVVAELPGGQPELPGGQPELPGLEAVERTLGPEAGWRVSGALVRRTGGRLVEDQGNVRLSSSSVAIAQTR